MSAEGTTPELSIVVPVYNEEENLRPLVAELRSALDPLRRSYEILLVDDGSADSSAAVIDRLVAEDPRIRAIHFNKNCGQTAAFDAGFRKARGRVVVTIDADLQNDPSDIPRLLDRLDGPERCDAVVGWRQERRDTLVRRVSSRVGNAVRNSLSGDSIRDTGCSLKAFRRECLAGLKLYKGMHRFLPTLLRMEGFRVVELPVGHRERRSGISKYGISNRALRGLVDLLAVRWMMRRRLDYTIVGENGIDHAE
jgi:dolichol-phosphate mannosyltransferase